MHNTTNKGFDKVDFVEAQKQKTAKTEVTITETTKYKMLKQNNVYTLVRKSDKATVELLKDNVEDYVLWGKKEFNKEANNTKF